MADNYLEKRMADYLAARGGSKPTIRRFGGAIRYPRRNVFVINAGNDTSRAIIRAFAEAGSLVGFTSLAGIDGTRLAQECGGRFYPLPCENAISDMDWRGENIDIIIGIGVVPQAIEDAKRIIISERDLLADTGNANVIIGQDAVQAAWICLMLAHPNSSIAGMTFRV